jgi:hypothetical protein
MNNSLLRKDGETPSNSGHQGGYLLPQGESLIGSITQDTTETDENEQNGVQTPAKRDSFTGFVVPKKNFFHMPNVWIDICAEIKNLAELKVVQYVLRHTWGFHEYGIPKAISVDEFMNGRRFANGSRMDKGTGLSNHSVIDGLRAAIQHGYLICEIDTSDTARIKKSYSLKMSSPPEDVAGGEDASPPEESTPSSEASSQGGVKHLHSRGEESSHRSEKDTLERHPEKDTRERQGESRRRNTEPLPEIEEPSLPSPSLSVFDFELITKETPHTSEAIMSIAIHYLGEKKATLQDAEAFIQKTQSTALLAGPHEVRKQLIANITFMLYSSHKSNWYKDKRNQVNLHNVEAYFDDYTRKSQDAQWTPPADKVPAWYQESCPKVADTSAPGDIYGMSRTEANNLMEAIWAEYPNMQISPGCLGDDRYSVGLLLGGDQWHELWFPSDWYRPDEAMKVQMRTVMTAYQQYAQEMAVSA